jgi:WD40 repeat protein
MTDKPPPASPPGRSLRGPIVAALITYVLAAVFLGLWSPHLPRLTISAGEQAQVTGFTPDGKSLLTFYPPQFIRYWNVDTGQPGTLLKTEGQWDLPTAFSEDSRRLSADGKRLSIGLMGSAPGEFNSVGRDYFNLETGEKISTVKFSANGKAFVTESLDGLLVACGEHDKTVVYDTTTAEVRCEVPAGTAAAFSADNKTIALATKSEDPKQWTVRLFDVANGDEQLLLGAGDGMVSRLAVSPEGDKLAIGVFEDSFTPSETRGIQLWDIAAKNRERTLPIQRDDVANLGRLQFTPDGKVLTIRGPLRAFAWDLSLPGVEGLIGTPQLAAFPPILSADGRLAAVLDVSTLKVSVLELGTGAMKVLWERSYGRDAVPVAINTDGRLIVAAYPPPRGWQRSLSQFVPSLGPRYEVLEVTSGRLLGTIPMQAESGFVGVSPDGKTLVTASYSPSKLGQVALWDVPTPTPWLAILGIPLAPAVLIGWLMRQRRRDLAAKETA